MILVDVFVPSVEQQFDFSLNETVLISHVIEEISALVAQREQCELQGDSEQLLLCDAQTASILPKNKTLQQCEIQNGGRLILV